MQPVPKGEPPMPANPYAFLTDPHACTEACNCTTNPVRRLRTRRNALCELCHVAFRDSHHHTRTRHHRHHIHASLLDLLGRSVSPAQAAAYASALAAFTRFASVAWWLRAMVRKIRSLHADPLAAAAEADPRIATLHSLDAYFRAECNHWARLDRARVRDARARGVGALARFDGNASDEEPMFTPATPAASGVNSISEAFSRLGDRALPGPLATEGDMDWSGSEDSSDTEPEGDYGLEDVEAAKGFRNAAMRAKYGRGMAGFRNGQWVHVPGEGEVGGSETDLSKSGTDEEGDGGDSTSTLEF